MSLSFAVRAVAVGCDHGGLTIKADVLKALSAKGVQAVDCGTHTEASCDYPQIAAKVVEKVLSKECDLGIVICGTGIGISIAANKYNGIRCALCHDHYTARMCRQHNDANILALGGRTTGPEVAKEIVETFISTEFMGAHHTRRLDMLKEIEASQKPSA
eukprot:TRINITY_DN6081_c0_g1_i2.p1 TRINITY_DN6081_c0_g1~~TRINITY_DN6081_c0_g1_i2.p1  ORF type:complete len:159 (-),score=35.45 TRINITY_DN6081_c0_g1_i2:286-762(-)